MITLTWLTKFWFLLLIAGVILLNSVYLKGNYLKHFFDFGELKRIDQKIKDESNYLGKSVYCFFGAIALFAYVCIYLGLVGLTLMIIIK